jgi:hypothetical protein
MSPPITYFPAYVGLFASLLLGVICNAYLDIQYGSFGTEVIVWAFVFAFTLNIAWRQHGLVSESGLFWQKVGVVLAVFLTFAMFMPVWGMPRAGLYLLASLQAATNCVTVNRRKFRLGLLASAVMVMFATAHYRADWTMLFYLVPYIFAVVFTLAAEQVCVRADESGIPRSHGQMTAIFAATVCILGLTFLLYSVTPQTTLFGIFWKYGQKSDVAKLNIGKNGGDGGQLLKGGSHGGGDESQLHGGAGGDAGAGDQDIANGGVDGPSGPGYRESGGRWPSVAEMRAAAKRPGMPRWQSRAIETMVELTQLVKMEPIKVPKAIQDLINGVGNYCSANKTSLLKWLAGLIALALAIAAWLLARETPFRQWLRVHFDYLRFGILGWHASGNAGVLQVFYAMQRLFGTHHVEREQGLDTREYLARVKRLHHQLNNQFAEATDLFEQARYGRIAPPVTAAGRMRDLYKQMYQRL